MINSSFIIACGLVVKAYYNNKSLLCNTGKPSKLRAIVFNNEIKGNDLLNLVTFEEVRLAINISQNYLYREWALMRLYYAKSKPVFGIESNNIKEAIKKSLMYFAMVLKYIIDNDIFSKINNEKDFIIQEQKLKVLFAKEKPI